MADIPGHLHWHPALNHLGAGMWLMCAAPALRVVPAGRVRLGLAILVVVIAGGLVALDLRASYYAGAWWTAMNGGWVLGGILPMMLAGLGAGLTAWLSGGEPARRCYHAGGAALLVLWCVPIGALAGLGSVAAWPRFIFIPMLMIAGLAGLTHPALAQVIAALALVVWAPAWRPVAGLALGAAVISALR